jgi:hypothetical protein
MYTITSAPGDAQIYNRAYHGIQRPRIPPNKLWTYYKQNDMTNEPKINRTVLKIITTDEEEDCIGLEHTMAFLTKLPTHQVLTSR